MLNPNSLPGHLELDRQQCRYTYIKKILENQKAEGIFLFSPHSLCRPVMVSGRDKIDQSLARFAAAQKVTFTVTRALELPFLIYY